MEEPGGHFGRTETTNRIRTQRARCVRIRLAGRAARASVPSFRDPIVTVQIDADRQIITRGHYWRGAALARTDMADRNQNPARCASEYDWQAGGSRERPIAPQLYRRRTN